MKTQAQIQKKINTFTAKLKKKADKKGIYENFGCKEIDALAEYIGPNFEYSESDKLEILIIESNFVNWCYNYEI